MAEAAVIARTDVAIRALGRTDCATTWRAMQAFTVARREDTPDEIWLTEHDPVYTLGLAGRREHLLRDNGIAVLAIDRGGQVTYHGPGQLVAYLMIDLHRRGLGIRAMVRAIEAAGEPTPVLLASFDATAGDDGILLSWSVTQDAGSLSFHVYRSGDDVEWSRIERAAVYHQRDGVTNVPLRLEAAESVFVVFREDLLPVNHDVEDAAAPADQFRVESQFRLDLGRQTGGPGEVVSLHAVTDLDVHGFLRGTGRAAV